jgi:hypothetical protein
VTIEKFGEAMVIAAWLADALHPNWLYPVTVYNGGGVGVNTATGPVDEPSLHE